MDESAPQSLHRIDVNLLVVLDVLLEVRSATAASERLALTRSAVSHSLRRVRELLGDELLIRRGDGVSKLTPFAEKLRGPLRRTLAQLESILPWHTLFEPSTAHSHFTLAASDWWTTYAFPILMQELSEQAPRLHLHIVQFDSTRVASQLEKGELDMAIGPISGLGPEFASVVLGKERLVAVVRPTHPFAKERPGEKEWREAKLAAVAPPTGLKSIEDDTLGHVRGDPHFAMTMPFTMSVPAMVKETDLVVILARILAKALQDQGHDLVIIEPPVELPEIVVKLLWHREKGQTPAQNWLRERIISLLAIVAARWAVAWESPMSEASRTSFSDE